MLCENAALYPATGVSKLRSQRGHRWAELVDWVATLPATDPQAMAFTFTVRRLRRHLFPDGEDIHDLKCAYCAARLVAIYEGSEEELLAAYYDNLQEIHGALSAIQTHTRRREQDIAA